MKIRVYSPYFPFPVTEGSHHVVFEQLRALETARHDVELHCWKDSREALLRKQKALPADSFLRRLRLVHTPRPGLRGALDRVTRIALSLLTGRASPEIYYYPIGLRGPDTGPVDLAIYNFSFSHAFFKRRPRPPENRRVVYFHNLESELARERVAGSGLFGRWLHARNARILERHEGELGALADETWFISPEDRDRYLALHPGAGANRVRLVPPGFDPSVRRPGATSASPELVLGFLGRMDFMPNFDSAAWIVRRLAPRLRAAGFAGRLMFVGNGMPPELAAEAKAFPFVEVHGFLPSTETFWAELDVLLCPHVSGSGVRIKVLEALARGVCAYTTPGGAARLHPELQSHPDLFVSEDDALWARRLAQQPKRGAAPPALPPALNSHEIYRFIPRDPA
jgi:glycosyltransferase involved in cell wall biosynthesis